MENVLSSTYGGFSDYLASLAENGLPIPERLRRLRRMGTGLDTHMNMTESRVDSQTHVYLTRAFGLVKTKIELLHFALRYPECHNTLADTGKGQITPFSLRWKGSLMNLMELIASLYYLRVITDGNGNRQSFASLMMIFKEFLHIRIPKPYNLCAGLARREKGLSVLPPKLREAFERDIVNCGIKNG